MLVIVGWAVFVAWAVIRYLKKRKGEQWAKLKR